jgi:nucleotide-binding universal stress UspA family protein
VTSPLPIVVGFDGSVDAQAAVAWAAKEARTRAARLRVVHAVGLLEHAGLLGEADGHRGVALAIARDAGLDPDNVEWSVHDGDPFSVLLRTTEPPQEAGLLVIGSRGAGAHAGMLLGSTSLKLAERARVPVTIVPATYYRNV